MGSDLTQLPAHRRTNDADVDARANAAGPDAHPSGAHGHDPWELVERAADQTRPDGPSIVRAGARDQ